MTYSRRDMTLLLPALAAAAAEAAPSTLPSRTYKYEDLEAKTNGTNHARNFFNGLTHTGYHIDMHETQLEPGMAPHPPHHHEHEESIMIREGLMEVTISGKSARLGPGSVAYVASNEEHGWRNVGETRASYFVMAFGAPIK